jgi:hypothetical protein
MRRVIGAILLPGLLVAGCGGGQAAPPERSGLIAEGDAICEENNLKLLEIILTEEGIPLEDTERAAEAVERLNAPGVDTTRRLAELEPPAELATGFERLVKLRHQRDQLQQELLDALKDGDAKAAADAQRRAVELYEGPIRDNAEELGFHVCGQPLPESR